MTEQELQVQQKREVESKQESTVPARIFIPEADIFESDQALTLVLEMPGASKESVEVSVDDDILMIEGRIDFSKYQGLHPLYTEYNIGNYSRRFQISNVIDQGAIRAEMKDGVMTLVLPKAVKAKPRRIDVS